MPVPTSRHDTLCIAVIPGFSHIHKLVFLVSLAEGPSPHDGSLTHLQECKVTLPPVCNLKVLLQEGIKGYNLNMTETRFCKDCKTAGKLSQKRHNTLSSKMNRTGRKSLRHHLAVPRNSREQHATKQSQARSPWQTEETVPFPFTAPKFTPQYHYQELEFSDQHATCRCCNRFLECAKGRHNMLNNIVT